MKKIFAALATLITLVVTYESIQMISSQDPAFLGKKPILIVIAISIIFPLILLSLWLWKPKPKH
jgi:uncharacterized membrane protein